MDADTKQRQSKPEEGDKPVLLVAAAILESVFLTSTQSYSSLYYRVDDSGEELSKLLFYWCSLCSANLIVSADELSSESSVVISMTTRLASEAG